MPLVANVSLVLFFIQQSTKNHRHVIFIPKNGLFRYRKNISMKTRKSNFSWYFNQTNFTTGLSRGCNKHAIASQQARRWRTTRAPLQPRESPVANTKKALRASNIYNVLKINKIQNIPKNGDLRVGIWFSQIRSILTLVKVKLNDIYKPSLRRHKKFT